MRTAQIAGRVLAWSCLACLFSVGTAHAQAPQSGESRPRLRAGQAVWVSTSDGSRVRGNVATVSTTELVVQDGVTSVPIQWGHVSTIRTHDPVLDGTLKGVAIGGLSGAGVSALYANALCEVGCPEFAIGMTALGAGIGAAIGVLADGLHHNWTTIYRQSRSISVAPVVVHQGAGIAGTVRW